MRKSITLWGDEVPLLAKMSDGWSLVALKAAPAITDGDEVMTLKVYHDDSCEWIERKREALELYLKITWSLTWEFNK